MRITIMMGIALLVICGGCGFTAERVGETLKDISETVQELADDMDDLKLKLEAKPGGAPEVAAEIPLVKWALELAALLALAASGVAYKLGKKKVTNGK